jgi:hypothetical protein
MDEDEYMRVLRETIGARLESVRGSMTDAEFTQLVDDVAINARKHEKRIMKWGSGS